MKQITRSCSYMVGLLLDSVSVEHIAICFNIRDGRTNGQTDHGLGPCNIVNDTSIFICGQTIAEGVETASVCVIPSLATIFVMNKSFESPLK